MLFSLVVDALLNVLINLRVAVIVVELIVMIVYVLIPTGKLLDNYFRKSRSHNVRNSELLLFLTPPWRAFSRTYSARGSTP